MFTTATLQLMKKHCSTEFENLLGKLGIIPDWSGDEFRVYDRLDSELTEKICGLMKSSTIIDGYMSLLDLSGVAYDYSETDNKLLRKIVTNGDKILRGLENLPKFIEEEVPLEPQTQQPPRPSQPKMKTITNEEHVTLKGPIILGIVLILAGAAATFMLGIFGVILVVLGVASLIAGVRGKTVRTTSTVPVEEKTPATP